MQSIRKRLQILARAEVVVDLKDILLPVRMIGLTIRRDTFYLRGNWGDPDSVEAGSLDVVEMLPRNRHQHFTFQGSNKGRTYIFYPLERPTAVQAISSIAWRVDAAIRPSEAIGEDLVDAPASPLFAGCCEGGRSAQCYRGGSSSVKQTHVVCPARGTCYQA